MTLRRLKRLSTFSGSYNGDALSHDRSSSASFGASMPRLAANCVSTDTVDFDSQFKFELDRIRAIVNSLFDSKVCVLGIRFQYTLLQDSPLTRCVVKHPQLESRVGHHPTTPTFEPGQLSSLHDDLHALLLSKAGAFIFEYYQSSLLPAAASLMYDNIKDGPLDLVSNLTTAWQCFYTHVLPALEAIFCNVNSPRLSVRQAALLVFRDVIVLKLEPQLGVEISAIYEEGSVTPPLTQMLLVIQNVSECYPPSKQRLQFEKLTARAISPYLGFRGIYSNGQIDPIYPSTELEVAHLRRTSVVDPRGLSRPLSVNSSLHMATLSDMFVVSADRFTKRTTSRENCASYHN